MEQLITAFPQLGIIMIWGIMALLFWVTISSLKRKRAKLNTRTFKASFNKDFITVPNITRKDLEEVAKNFKPFKSFPNIPAAWSPYVNGEDQLPLPYEEMDNFYNVPKWQLRSWYNERVIEERHYWFFIKSFKEPINYFTTPTKQFHAQWVEFFQSGKTLGEYLNLKNEL